MFTDEFKRYLLIIVSIILILFIIIGAKTGIAHVGKNTTYTAAGPVQEVFVNVNNWIKDKFAFFPNMFNSSKKIKELQKQNDTLLLENGMYKKYKKQNDELKRILELKQMNPYNGMITATVVGVDPNNMYKAIIIDKGKKDNVEKDMIVITPDGLVGRVLETQDRYSKIMAITDDRMTIGANVERTGEKLVINGNNIAKKNTCRIENIALDANLLVGDDIYTSNVSMLYPEGLKIGTLKDIKVASDEITKVAVIDTFVNIDKLQYVILIKNKEMLEDEIEEVFSEFNSANVY